MDLSFPQELQEMIQNPNKILVHLNHVSIPLVIFLLGSTFLSDYPRSTFGAGLPKSGVDGRLP